MKTNNIPLCSFLPHGKVEIIADKRKLCMTVTATVNTGFTYSSTPIKSYIYLPDKYKLPFQINMTVKIDSPSFYLIIGKGHVGFATGMDNRRVTSILGDNIKPNTHDFDNHIPIGEYFDISVTYDNRAMWVMIDNEIRCFSKKDPYIKALKNDAIPDEFNDGFNLALACDKRTRLTLESFAVTEFEDDEPALPAEPVYINSLPVFVDIKRKDEATLEECIEGLNHDLQNEVLRTDDFILHDLKKTMKFKRKIEGGYPISRICYVSPLGISYKIFIAADYLWHDIGWIVYNTKREQEKYGGYRKSDYTIETLHKLAKKDLKFADEMFLRIRECCNCAPIGGNKSVQCIHRTLYEYNSKKINSCGKFCFKMFTKDFVDLRELLAGVSDYLISEGIK